MLCNRCWDELPSHTPVCPACGPLTLGAGFTPPPPPAPFALPGAASLSAVLPTPPPPPPLGAPGDGTSGVAAPESAFAALMAGGLAAAARTAGRLKDLDPAPRTRAAPARPALPVPPVPPREPRPAGADDKAEARAARKKKAREAMAALKARTGEAGGGRGALGAAMEAEGRPDTDAAPLRRPGAIGLLAALNLLAGAAHLIVAWAALSGRLPAGAGGPADGMEAVLDGLYGMLLAATALWLLALHPLGRYAQIAIAVFGVFAGFVSLLASAGLLVYFLRPGVALLFSGRDPSHLPTAQREKVAAHAPSPRLVPAAVAFLALRWVADLLPPLLALSRG